MRIPVSICTNYFTANKNALVDSGATDNFMHLSFVHKMGINPQKLDKPRKIWNADSTENKEGMITHFLDLEVETKRIRKVMRFYITNIGKEDIFLGYPWLAAFEPQFIWKDTTIDEKALPVVICSINLTIPRLRPTIAQTTLDDLKLRILHQLEEQSTIQTTSTDLVVQAGQYLKKVTIPPQYQRFAKVFSEEESQRFPPSRPWDHAIEFKPGTPDAIDCKVYPMSRTEDDGLKTFLEEQLVKRYIRPSKSPYASSFFFIKKKDGKLRPVQDYRRINDFTIRNQYPLPLISDLITDLRGAHIYTKLDIC